MVIVGGILIEDGRAVLVWGLPVEGGEGGVVDSDFDAAALPVGVLAGEILVEG